jgi:hypothetical protein
MCVSTSLMPTPGPPLRDREGIIRRGRDAEAVAGAEADGAGVEGPACEAAAAGSVLEIPPPPLPLPPLADADAEADVEDATGPATVFVVEFAGAVAAVSDTVVAAAAAGNAVVDADARLGIMPRRTRGTR